MNNALLLVGSSIVTAVSSGLTCLGVDKWKKPKIAEDATEEEIAAAIKKNNVQKEVIKIVASVGEAAAVSTGAMLISENLMTGTCDSSSSSCSSDTSGDVSDEAVEDAAFMLTMF